MAKTERERMADTALLIPDADKVLDISRLLGESEELTGARLSAYRTLDAAILPDRVQHLWRFTNPVHLLPGDPTVAAAVPFAAVVGDTAAARVALRAGAEPWVTVSPAAAAAGVRVTPIASSADLSVAAPEGDDAGFGLFRGLNAALWNCGVKIHVPRGARLDAPLHVEILAGVGAILPRIVVAVGEGAEITLVEEHSGGSEGTRVVGRTELVLADGARVRHALVQRWNNGVNGHLTARASVGRDADLLTAFASLGGDRAKMELLTDLAGEGARSEMTGIVYGSRSQRFDHHTRHRHLAGRTWSNIEFKAVADDQSRSSYTGLIRIEEQARVSEAYQENRNLLLSGAGRVDSIPELEILNEEVSCSHGATVSPVDPEQVFYLQSRGLAPSDAVRLVVQGFLAKTIDRLPAGVRETVAGLIDTRLEGLRGRAA